MLFKTAGRDRTPTLSHFAVVFFAHYKKRKKRALDLNCHHEQGSYSINKRIWIKD